MKKVWLIFLLALLVGMLLGDQSVLAQSDVNSDRNLIFTEGIAEVTGLNDSAKIAVAVVTNGRNLEQVTSDNAKKTKAVISAVKSLNMTDLKLKTANYRVTPQKDYKTQPPKIKGYEVYNSVMITMQGFESEQLSRYTSKIIGKALESGANNIHQIQFYIKNKEPLEKIALTKATEEAMARARILADAAGVKLKRIVTLSTRPMQTPRPNLFRAAEMKADSAATAPPIEIGESQIRVQVNVVYEIE